MQKSLILVLNFDILSTEETNKFEILEKAKAALADYFEKPLEIGESIQITDLYNVLKNVEGIADAKKIKIVNRSLAGYSTYTLNIDKSMSSDGRYLFIPEDAVAELKIPRTLISREPLDKWPLKDTKQQKTLR